MACDWEPDDNMVLAARRSQLSAACMSGPDRAWVVASLSVQGLSAAEIARSLSCSDRLVKQVRAEPMTQVARFAIGSREELVAERARARGLEDGLRIARERYEREIAALRDQRAGLIETVARLRQQTRRTIT